MTEKEKMGWTIESSEVVGDFDVMQIRRVMAKPPKGDKTLPFHVVDTAQCVEVIGVTKDDRIIMVEQYRQGIAKKALEFPGGLIDEGEDCGEAGLRELLEETGYSAERQEVIGRIATDPALHSAHMTIVAAYGCTKTDKKNEDEGEAVRTRLVTREEMEKLIDSGELESGDAIAGWYLFNRRAASNGSRP
jgi:ADP-ribose pyrophosphatase